MIRMKCWNRSEIKKKMSEEIPDVITVKHEHLPRSVRNFIRNPSKTRWEDAEDAPDILNLRHTLVHDELISSGTMAGSLIVSPGLFLLGFLVSMHMLKDRPELVSEIQKRQTILTRKLLAFGAVDKEKELEIQKLHGKKLTSLLYSTEKLAETHPVAFIDASGNLIFKRFNRFEQKIHKFQKGLIGKTGINPWFYRMYLRKDI